MRNWQETLEWYRTHQTGAQIGFDPDGMCLKVCRTARAIGSKYLTAKQAQDATPAAHRVPHIADLRRGMVLFFDTVGDSNPYGHIVTMIGRVKGGDHSELSNILVETNSVVANEVVVVHGDYFAQHWGDQFQFGATMLNGVELDVPSRKPKPPPAPKKKPGTERLANFKESRPDYNVNILDRVVEQGRRDVKRHVERLEHSVSMLPDDLKDKKVKQFKDGFANKRILRMKLLDEYIKDGGKSARVKVERARLNSIIKKINTL